MEFVLPVRALARAALRSKALERLLVAAPSFQEMGVYYHLLSLLRDETNGEPTYDCIILDMPATGHTLALTGLPDVLLQIMPTGPIAAAFREGQTYLNNPARGGAIVVTLPELLPVTESLELMEGLRETRVEILAIAVNKVLGDLFTAEEREAMTALCAAHTVYGEGRLLRTESAREAMLRLEAGTHGIPRLLIPEIPGRGAELVAAIATHLSGEGGM
jgi:anion-transporting  ArsA/GET3 family ATPase